MTWISPSKTLQHLTLSSNLLNVKSFNLVWWSRTTRSNNVDIQQWILLNITYCFWHRADREYPPKPYCEYMISFPIYCTFSLLNWTDGPDILAQARNWNIQQWIITLAWDSPRIPFKPHSDYIVSSNFFYIKSPSFVS